MVPRRSLFSVLVGYVIGIVIGLALLWVAVRVTEPRPVFVPAPTCFYIATPVPAFRAGPVNPGAHVCIPAPTFTN